MKLPPVEAARLNVADTVTLEAGMMKVYFPPPSSVRVRVFPFASLTVRVSSS